MIICIIIKMHWKPLLQMQDLHIVFTACTRRAHSAQNALYKTIALPQRAHSALSNTLCKRQAAAFVLSMFKINAAAWHSMRLHSVFTAFLQSAHSIAGDCTARTSAICNFERCGNAVRTPLWCDRSLR